MSKDTGCSPETLKFVDPELHYHHEFPLKNTCYLGVDVRICTETYLNPSMICGIIIQEKAGFPNPFSLQGENYAGRSAEICLFVDSRTRSSKQMVNLPINLDIQPANL